MGSSCWQSSPRPFLCESGSTALAQHNWVTCVGFPPLVTPGVANYSCPRWRADLIPADLPLGSRNGILTPRQTARIPLHHALLLLLRGKEMSEIYLRLAHAREPASSIAATPVSAYLNPLQGPRLHDKVQKGCCD